MSIGEAFSAALAEITARSPEPLLLPDRVARACLAALSVDGAGLSYTSTPGRRVPIEASDPTAATAERLRFALGDGPCFQAQRSGRAVSSTMPQLRRSWPVYAHQLATHTPYAGVLAAPIGGPLSGFASTDLFTCAP